jgi:hypothetical protein
MKNNKLANAVILLGLFALISCTNQNANKTESINSESTKQSLWNDSLKKVFIIENSETDFEKFIITELIAKYEFDKNALDLQGFLQTQEFDFYRKAKTKSYVVNVDNLAGKSKREIVKILGKPNYVEKVNPSRTPCPCDKYNYLNDLVEIVFINGKADWITINNRSSFAVVENLSAYKSINRFDDYTYIKVKTK